jgi:hypothetical protein
MTVWGSAEIVPIIAVLFVRLSLEALPKSEPDKADKGDYADRR